MTNNSLSAQQTLFSFNELTGKVKPANSNNPFSLRGEVYTAFLKMQKAAAIDGIKIKIVSSYRSFTRQQQIWNRKYKKFTNQGLSPETAINKIIEYSTLPGTSRHHWGTDIDIVLDIDNPPTSLLNPTNFKKNNIFYPLKQWLDKNALTYGFELVYTADPNRKGFKYEPWHYSYAPTSKSMLSEYISCKIIKQLNQKNTSGSYFLSIKFISNYLNSNILQIKPTLIPE
ncbi:M15 family metallopeptidase [Aquimarina agarivorans]|uniref:M15 family metallopeptidase n=1 Tax=Aquimarina agarivorans TaxID=980584 RepID=UPI000248F58D|nr:M15 family metallopeptidase [Aquimarina agarivorans]